MAPHSDASPGVICLVPQELPQDLVESLDDHFSPRGIAVRVVRGRRFERRNGRDRRDTGRVSATMMERRFAPDLEARRFGERRGEYERVDAPILPSAALPYADKLRFVRRRSRPGSDGEISRLRQLAEAWRDRAIERDREATGLLKALVGVVEDVRQLRTMSPRWLLALRRGERAIEQYRRRHLTE